jgi:hypothetical protein
MLRPLIAEPREDIRENYLLMSTLSLIYTLLQVGDFYYAIALSEPYRSYQNLFVATTGWLMTNGLIGLFSMMYFTLYIFYYQVRIFHVKTISRLFIIIGLIWTIFGYFFVNFAYLGTDTGFMSYFVMKLIIQTTIYVFCFGFSFFNY